MCLGYSLAAPRAGLWGQAAAGHSGGVAPYLNARHRRLLHQEGDEDEPPQALSPGQRYDGVQVPAGRAAAAFPLPSPAPQP